MTVSLDRFVRSAITRSTRTVSRRGFNVAMLVGHHQLFIDRVREYTRPEELLEDGFHDRHPLYLAAVRLKSQDPAPDRFKVGRREGAPVQLLRFTPVASPIETEVFTVALGGVSFSYVAQDLDTIADVTAALVALINPDPDAVIASGASAVATQELSGAALDGVVGGAPISPPRNATLTFAASADWIAGNGLVTGKDQNGRTITESFAVPVGGGSVTLTRVFSQITQVDLPAAGGATGTFTMGVGKAFANALLEVTATDNTTSLDVVADNAGAWYGLDGTTINLDLDDRTVEPATTLAADLTAIDAADADWYGLDVVDAQSEGQITAIAAWVEAREAQSLYLAHSADSDVEDDVETDVASGLRDADFLRTKVFYSRRNHGRFPAAGIMGRIFGAYEPGEATWEFKAVAGLLPDDLSSAVVSRLVGPPEDPANSKRCMIYVSALPAGTNVGTSITTGGLSAGGEWLEVIQGLDLTESELQAVAFNLQISESRVPFTRRGIARFQGLVEAVLIRLSAAPNNVFDPESIVVSGTTLEGTTAADRQARFYNGVRWGARVQGAIRLVDIGGNVTP